MVVLARDGVPSGRSASVSKRTTGAVSTLRPLALLPHGVPLQGPPVARSVVPSFVYLHHLYL